MVKLIALGIVGIIICSIFLSSTFSEDGSFKKRKMQSKNLLKENIIRNKLNEIVEKKVKISRRIKVEKICIMAGYDITYSDYLIICILSALFISSFFKIVINNSYLSVIFLLSGGFFPYQYLMVKANARSEKLNQQVGSFLQMLIRKFNTSKNIKNAIETTNIEFKDEQPLSDEIQRMVYQISLGKTINQALKEFSDRTQNQYLIRFADYYEISAEIGTNEARSLLDEALHQYKEDKKNKLLLKKEISSIKSEAYIVLAGVPLVAVYQTIMDKDYISFMTNTVVGQIGTAIIVIVTLLAFWFINKKIGAPIK